MQIDFKNGEMIIKHDSGIETRYDQIDLQKQKSQIDDIITKFENERSQIVSNISSIQSTLGY